MGQKNGLYTLGCDSAESEPIWMKSGILWAKFWGLALTDFGLDPHSSGSLRGSRFFVFFDMWITHDFTDFPSNKFYDIWTQQRRSVRWWKFSEQFWIFYHKGSFSKKSQKLLKKLQVLRLQAIITPQWLQMPKTHGQMTFSP